MLDLGTLRINVEADASAAEKSLKGVKSDVEELETSSDKATSGMSGGWKSFASTAGTVAVGAFAGLTAAVGGLVSIANETQEDMGKLDTAFQQSGFSAEAATSTYRGFVGLLGETDTAVEASNHLAKLCDNEQQLADWTTIASGVFATFGDSLPLEGLTEAANETAKTGTVVGSLADALNWAGVSEDDFNQKLAACNTEQERAQLITDTLNGLYGETGEAYQENNKNLIEFRQAQSDLNTALSELGTALMPIVTALINFGVTIANNVMPFVSQLGTAIQETFGGSGDVIQGLVSQFISLANTIGTSLQPVIAAILPSVQSFIDTLMSWGTTISTYVAPYVQALIDLVMQIGSTLGTLLMPILQTIIPVIMSLATQFQAFSQTIIATVLPVWTQVINVITQFVNFVTPILQGALNVILTTFNTVWPSIQQVVTSVFSVIQSVVSTVMGVIQGIIQVVMGVISGDWSAVWSGIQGIASSIWSGIQGVISGAISAIQGIISAVLGTIQGLWNGAWSAISSFLSGIWNGIVNAVSNGINTVVNFFANLPGNILSALGNLGGLLLDAGNQIIQGLINGIQNAAGSVVSAITGVVGGAIDAAKSFLGIASPSKVFKEIGDFTMQGMELGIEEGASKAVDAAKSAAQQVTDAFNPELETPAYKNGIIDTASRKVSGVLSFVQGGGFKAQPQTASTSLGDVNYNYYIGDTKVDTITEQRFAEEFIGLMNKYGRLAVT